MPSLPTPGTALRTATAFFLCRLLLAVLPADAGDTLFLRSPDPRLWDTTFMYEVFTDPFDGTSLNTGVWHVQDCRGRGSIPTNNETDSPNLVVSNGTLKMTARHEPGDRDTSCWEGGFTSDYTTAEIYAIHRRTLYGSFEARCRLPGGKGLFFAFWLWGKGDRDGFPKDEWASEIDIAEKIGNTLIHAFHYWPPAGPEIPILRGQKRIRWLPGVWHTFRVIWTPYRITFSVDGEKTWEKQRFYTGRDSDRNGLTMEEIRPGTAAGSRNWFPRHACAPIFQMQLNKSIAGQEARSLPATLEVDYVRIRQFFKAPEILCPDTLDAAGVALLDADPRASDLTWKVTPAYLFDGESSGPGRAALLLPSAKFRGHCRIVWTYRMPSGEQFSAEKDFLTGTIR